MRLTHQSELAEEVLNDVMFVVWQKASTYNAQSRVSTWILGIAYRKELNVLAQVRRRTSLEIVDENELLNAQDMKQDADRQELRDWLDKGLQRLSPEHRMAVELTHFLGYSYQEIAAIADCPVGTVKTRMFHARKQLRDVLARLAGLSGTIEKFGLLLIADQAPVDVAYLPALAKDLGIATGGRNEGQQAQTKAAPRPVSLQGSSVIASELTLSTDRGSRPTYRFGEAAVLSVQTTKDVYAYCYYEPAQGRIVKIFPNRFAKERKSSPSQTLLIPSSDEYSIRFDRPDVVDKVMCMASRVDIERNLPFEPRVKELQAISLETLGHLYPPPVNSIEDIYRVYKDSAKVVLLKFRRVPRRAAAFEWSCFLFCRRLARRSRRPGT